MKKVTMDDVADLAGVSKSTVSAVVNNKDIVRESTRRAVLQAIEELDYRPYGGVRRFMPASENKSLCYIMKESDNPYYAEILQGIEDVVRKKGYLVFSCSSGGELAIEQEIVAESMAREMTGVIITPILNADTDLAHLFELKRNNIPIVLLEQVQGLQANLVDIDNVSASCRAAKHLIELGHTRLLHLRGPLYSKHSDERAEGVRRAFSETHLTFNAAVVLRAGDSLNDGYRAGLDFFRNLEPSERPTGVTCYNDLVALGLMKALHELQIRVPEDVSVIGFDDLQILDFSPVALTTVHVPKREMGRRAAEMLLQQIEKGGGTTIQKIPLEAPLITRGTTAPPQVAVTVDGETA